MKHVNYNVLDPRSPAISGLLNDWYQDTKAGSIKRFTPQVDVYENELQFGIILSIPGMLKEDIKIETHDNKLFVSGEKKLTMREGVTYHVQEISYGVFSKIFHLPKIIDQEKIEAKYEVGLLHLLLPKNQKLTHKYQVKIK